jgi:hypothetical protein
VIELSEKCQKKDDKTEAIQAGSTGENRISDILYNLKKFTNKKNIRILQADSKERPRDLCFAVLNMQYDRTKRIRFFGFGKN